MAVPKRGPRWLGLFVFLGCVGLSVGGLWYLKNGGWSEDDQETDDDDEVTPEGVGYRQGPKKKTASPRSKKRPTESRQARSGPAPHPGGAAPPGPAGPSGPSYESAIAGNNLNLAPGTKDVPDLTDAELSGPMRDGTFLDACGVPASTHVTVKVAIRNGHAVGVSAYPTPPSKEMAWCIERYVRGLQWPTNAKMDSFITSY